jgi:hypothetical protein
LHISFDRLCSQFCDFNFADFLCREGFFMSAKIITLSDASGALRRGTPVETNDGRIGWVRDWDFHITDEGHIAVTGYHIQLTDGRGALYKEPDKVQKTVFTRAGIGKAAQIKAATNCQGVA